MKGLGARQHPRSGAGAIKDDGSTDDAIYEVKDRRKSYTLKGRELKDLFVRGVRQGKDAYTVVYFGDEEGCAIIRWVPGKKVIHG